MAKHESIARVSEHEHAIARFREIERQLPGLLDALLAGPPYQRGEKSPVPPVACVYLFTEGGIHRYVGRTRNANRRLGEHTRPSSKENSAPFAFNVARAEARSGGLDVAGSRTAVAALPGFNEHFAAAKKRVRAMEFRVVEVVDPALSTIFEVYASIALGTEGEFNLFETSLARARRLYERHSVSCVSDSARRQESKPVISVSVDRAGRNGARRRTSPSSLRRSSLG